MTNTTYTLQLVPKGYKVVPEEPDGDILQSVEIAMAVSAREDRALGAYIAIMEAAPPLNTPPVLRWEGGDLRFFGSILVTVYKCYGSQWAYYANPLAHFTGLSSEQEARRAAEKALGFPDGLVIEEV